MARSPFEAELHAEMARYYADPLGFVLAAYPWPIAGQAGPDRWQAEVLTELGTAVTARAFDGVHPVMPIREAISSGHGIGKANSYSTVTCTPQGDVEWGMIQPGDTVFGADGWPTEVIARHEQGVQRIYRVTFDDGSSTLCTAEHLWNVRGRHERRNKREGWRTLSTKAIRELGVTRANGDAQARQWEIPLQGAVQFPTATQTVHPYLFGVWLGDGTKGQGHYTKPHPELADRIRHLGYQVWNHGTRKYIPGLSASMRREPVFHCGSHERFIPDAYKYADVVQRTELLRGLLDTDGEVHGSGSIGYSTTSEQLLNDLLWLVRSLGGKAQRQPTEKRGWYPDDDGQRVECRRCYRATIQLDWNPFTLAHRKAAYKPSEHRYLVRWIDSIEYSHDEEAMCITVAAPDGLYLTSDFIVTHNSALFAWIVDWLMSTRADCRGTVTANTNDQLSKKTWAAVQEWTARCLTAHWFEINSIIMFRKGHRPTWFCSPQPCAEENSEAFAGQHAITSSSFYLFDEASAVPKKIYEVAEGGLTDGEPFFIVGGNPTRNTGKFHEAVFGSQRDRWTTHVIDSRTCALRNDALIKEWEADYGEDSDFFRVRVRGLPPSASEAQFIDTDRVFAAQRRVVETLPDEPLVAGVDVSGGGNAWTVCRFRRGFDARTLKPIRITGEASRDRNHIISLLADALNQGDWPHRIDAMFVDSAFGSPIVERLRVLGYKHVHEVNFGAKAPDVHDANFRAFMWRRMKEWLVKGGIPRDDQRLEQDLGGPGYHLNPKDQLNLESKDSMQKRGVASPDDGDALALTFAQAVRTAGTQRRSRWAPVPQTWAG